MNLPNRRRAERPAPVHSASLVALVRVRRPVVDVALTATVVAAAAQLGVERVERARVEGANLDATEQRPNVLGRVAGVGLARAALPCAQLEVLVQQLVHRRVRAGLALFVDLVEKPRPSRLSQPARLRARRDRLDEITSAARGGVLTCVDPHSQRAARQLVNGAARALTAGAGPCHDASVPRSCVTIRVMTPHLEL